MRRLAIWATTLVVLGYASLAEAGGRAACRVVWAPPLWGVCYAEQVVWAQGPLEAAVGLEWRWPEQAVSAYSVLAWYAPGWWTALEVGRSISAWRWAVSGGVRW